MFLLVILGLPGMPGLEHGHPDIGELPVCMAEPTKVAVFISG